jgi:hypothetical protein
MWFRVRRVAPVVAAGCAGLAVGVLMAASQRLPPAAPLPGEPADAALREEVATLRQLQAVDRQAQSMLRQQITQLTAQNGELNRRLLLLQRVLVPDGMPAAVGIADLRLAVHGQSQRTSFRLLLARASAPQDAGKLVGRVELWVTGVQQGRAQQLRVAQLPLALERVQHVTGSLALPADISPQALRVDVLPRGQAPMSFEYAWLELIDGAGAPSSAGLAR